MRSCPDTDIDPCTLTVTGNLRALKEKLFLILIMICEVEILLIMGISWLVEQPNVRLCNC